MLHRQRELPLEMLQLERIIREERAWQLRLMKLIANLLNPWQLLITFILEGLLRFFKSKIKKIVQKKIKLPQRLIVQSRKVMSLEYVMKVERSRNLRKISYSTKCLEIKRTRSQMSLTCQADILSNHIQ